MVIINTSRSFLSFNWYPASETELTGTDSLPFPRWAPWLQCHQLQYCTLQYHLLQYSLLQYHLFQYLRVAVLCFF